MMPRVQVISFLARGDHRVFAERVEDGEELARIDAQSLPLLLYGLPGRGLFRNAS